MVKPFVLLGLLVLSLGCPSVTHYTIPDALEGSKGDRVELQKVVISWRPDPEIIDGKWAFWVLHPEAIGGEHPSLMVFIDADAFQPEVRDLVTVTGDLWSVQDKVLVFAKSVTVIGEWIECGKEGNRKRVFP